MESSSQTISVFCPAKVNLFLAITGKRADGFHNLCSLVAQCDFGDDLTVGYLPDGKSDECRIDDPSLSTFENTMMMAAKVLREHLNFAGAFSFELKKRIPHGAGLGGGSSDGVQALQAMIQLLGVDLEPTMRMELAARIGSDCPLFLGRKPLIIRGRGEITEDLVETKARLLAGREIHLVKPPFGISTPEAYRRLAQRQFYSKPEVVEKELADWVFDPAVDFPPALNDFERLLPTWHPSLAVVLRHLNNELGWRAGMSGSGSALWVVEGESPVDSERLKQYLNSAWGEKFFFVKTKLL